VKRFKREFNELDRQRWADERSKRGAKRQTEFLTGRPLALIDELYECLREEGSDVVAPRWAVEGAVKLLIEYVKTHRSGGRNASHMARAWMDVVHRVRYEAVLAAKERGFEGREVFEAAAVISEGLVENNSATAVRRSYEKLVRDPNRGEFSSSYFTADEPVGIDRVLKLRVDKLNAIMKKQESRKSRTGNK